MSLNLYRASQSGSLEGGRAVLATGEDVNMRGEYGSTPLMAAVRGGHSGGDRITTTTTCPGPGG